MTAPGRAQTIWRVLCCTAAAGAWALIVTAALHVVVDRPRWERFEAACTRVETDEGVGFLSPAGTLDAGCWDRIPPGSPVGAFVFVGFFCWAWYASRPGRSTVE